MTKKSLITLFTAIGIALSAMQGYAGTFTAFGPKTFVRGSGKPVVETTSLNIKNPYTTYTLYVYNGSQNSEYSKVSSATIQLNGTTIFDTNDFNQQVSQLQKQVVVASSNNLSVELRSTPGSGLTVLIEGEDGTPPSVVINSPINGTYLNDPSVTISGTASDAISWVSAITVNGTAAQLSGKSFNSSIKLIEGQNTITATGTDAAGNTANASVSVILDTIPPKITIGPVPSLTNKPQFIITGKIEDASPISLVTVNSIAATLANNTFTATVNLKEGNNNIVIAATDEAGNIEKFTTGILLDTIPPAVTITSPVNQTRLNTPSITVTGMVSDEESGISKITVNNTTALVDGNVYTATIQLTEGESTISVRANDNAGNITVQTGTITLDTTPPVITITSPANGSIITTDKIAVTGVINDNLAEVSVNGINATVINNSTFTVSNITLTEGANTIIATATDPAGNKGIAVIKITRQSDTIPPIINITSPTNGSEITTAMPLIQGTIYDAGSGPSPFITVTVNGITMSSLVSLTCGSSLCRFYFIPYIRLIEGVNTILIAAKDRAGNSDSSTITVYLADTTPPQIYVTSPLDGSTVKNGTVTVTGTVSEKPAAVAVNGLNAAILGSTFSATVFLTEGANTITITTKDSAGNTGNRSIIVYLDTIPPSVLSVTPTNWEIEVPVNSFITVEFSEKMNLYTFTTSTIALNSKNWNVAGSITFEGNTVIFTPRIPLSSDTTYAAIIKGGSSGVKDLAGNTMATDYVWNFRTLQGPLEVDVTEPSDGCTINKKEVTVKGTIKSLSDDVGIKVNGIFAEINGRNWAATVPLSIGLNMIEATAMDAAGNTDKQTITINTQTTDQSVKIATNPTSEIAPLNATFTIDTSITYPIVSYKIDFEGDGVTDFETTNVSNITHIYDIPRIYSPTVTVTDSQGNTYTETTVINVLDRTQMDTLLKSKWEGMKGALASGNIDGALSYYLDGSKEKYQTIYTALKDQLPGIIAAMNDIELIYIENGKAQYRIRRLEAEGEFTYYISFIMDSDGLWRIYQY